MFFLTPDGLPNGLQDAIKNSDLAAIDQNLSELQDDS